MLPAVSMLCASKTFPGPDGGVVHALKAATFDVPAGNLVAVLGRSGSGKSTLLNLVAGLDRPSKGSVQVAGTDLGTLGESDLGVWRGRHVGIVFQFFQLVPVLTARENVMLAMDFVGRVPRTERTVRADALLASVGVADQADKLPATLSGGQQQRVAIARALANDPALVVADEPTGNLDSRTGAAVLDVLLDLSRRGRTVLCVTHDETVARRADRTIRLHDGRLVEDTGGNASPTSIDPSIVDMGASATPAETIR